MNTSSPQTADSVRSQIELAEVIQCYAEFRLNAQRDFQKMERQLREQILRLQENDRRIHELHVERIELKNTLEAARADVEIFSTALAEAEAELQPFREARQSPLWNWIQHLIKLARPKSIPPRTRDLPGVPFTYYLYTSPYRVYRPGNYTLRGWAFANDGRPVTAIRIRVGEFEYAGRCNLEDAEVARVHGSQLKQRNPGFEVPFEISDGKHRLRLEVCLENKDWVSILNTWVWCHPSLQQK